MVTIKPRIWRALLALALVGSVFVAFLPNLLSSRVVYGRLLDRLRAEQFRLNVESMSLSWLAPIRLTGISIEQEGKQGSKLLQIREVRSEKNLLPFLLSRRQLGRWEVIEPEIDVKLLQDGSNVQDLARAIGGDKPKTAEKNAPARVDVEVGIRRASVVVRKADGSSPLVVVPPLDCDLSYSWAEGEPIVDVQPTQWLSRVKLTPELMNIGLELALPALADATWLDGEVSLRSGAIHLPLNRLVESKGDATISLHDVRAGLQKAEMIAVANMLARLVGQEGKSELSFINGSEVLVQVENGFVSHEGMRLGLPRVDQRLQIATSGRVGMLDRSLQGMMEFPVPLQWLARNEDVRNLGVPTVSLPISGTLDEPTIEWTAMRQESAELLALIRNQLGDNSAVKTAAVATLEGLASGKGDDAIRATADLVGQLRELRRKRVAQDEQTNPENQDKQSEAVNPYQTEGSRRGPLERLRRRLRQE